MEKERKRNIVITAVLVFVIIMGFSVQHIAGKNDSAANDSVEEIETENTTEPEVEELEERKSVETSSSTEDEKEITEEVAEPEERVEEESVDENEEKIPDKEITPASTKTESTEKAQAETKPITPQASPEPIEKTKPKEVVEKSKVKMTEYLLPFSNSEERVEKTTHVVLHFTSNALNNPQNPYLIEDTYNIFKDYGVSAHYVIGRSGEIYLFVPENRVAYHAGRGQLKDFPEYNDQLNHYSIGIELLAMGTREEMIPVITAEKYDLVNPSDVGYTEAQYNSLNVLLNDIIARYPHIQKNRSHIVGHDEYSVGTKTDPGRLFNWSKIGL